MDIITKEQVKFAKIAANIRSEDIWKAAGIGKATLERFESGKSKPELDTLNKIKKAVDELLLKSGWELLENGGIQPIERSDI